MISKAEFKEIVRQALKNIKVSNKNIELFLKDDSKVTLEEIKVCTAVTEVLDKHIKSLYKDFDASLYNDTFETLYNYHKHLDENKD
jgi:hypothetical protein